MKLDFQLSNSVSPCRPVRSRGVALVITVIMLSVITFMAITFLALARREKGVVATTKDLSQARFAADSALERAKAEILANILATDNTSAFDFLVATNFTRLQGFDPAAVDGFTNVNYDYQEAAGLPSLTPVQVLQNLTNLYFNPRPPVWIVTNKLTGAKEFRYYLDLNRNTRHDRSGLVVVTNELGQATTNTANVVGDPEWIGILEKPLFGHSGTNRFVARYTYAVIPTGKTLDVNYIHNYSKRLNASMSDAGGDGFLRNQGVGSWEINLAAFLADLNTNYWNPIVNPYAYKTNVGLFNTGVAFEDALSLLRYRYNGDYTTLASVNTLYGGQGNLAFTYDGIDGYVRGPFMNSLSRPADNDGPLVTTPWPGADNYNHFFTAQEFYDTSKSAFASTGVSNFVTRLRAAGSQLSTYDQYTYYRLLSQLGTDSSPDQADKINLNYINVAPFAATNFVPWDDPRVDTAFGFASQPEQRMVVMFTNIADRLLRRYSQDWRDNDRSYYTNFFGINTDLISITNIPVWVNDNFVYTPAIHRILQVAANIVDTTTNRVFGTNLPSVFRPVFERRGNDFFINAYVESGGDVAARMRKPLALDDPSDRALIQPTDNIYGVPWVIGVKKGIPNFNEYAMHSHFEITRKIILTRLQPGGSLQTNLMYNLSVSNAFGMETWNSYGQDFTRGVGIFATNEISMLLTNSDGLSVPLVRVGSQALGGGTVITPPERWSGYKLNSSSTDSFKIPVQIAIQHQPAATYLFASPPRFASNVTRGFETNYTLYPDPTWQVLITNRMRLFMVDQPSKRVIDYVQLGTFISTRNISNDIAQVTSSRVLSDGNNRPGNSAGRIFKEMWNPTRAGPGGISSLTRGMTNQIFVSLHKADYPGDDWKDLGQYDSGVESSNFLRFLTSGEVGSYQVPYTPSIRLRRYYSWQANDPLVHYMSGDLERVEGTNDVMSIPLQQQIPLLTSDSTTDFGRLNKRRFNPWGGYPGAEITADDGTFYDLSLKDPLIKLPDDWQFHTNAFPSIGWLGRIHRGTPWQTIYLKSSDAGITAYVTNAPLTSAFVWSNSYPAAAKRWAKYSGNPNYYDGFYTRPANDRVLFDVFTTAVNDNATRGQLPVNQTGLAAWSAVLGGVIALSNSATAKDITFSRTNFEPLIVQPAGYFNASDSNTWPAIVRIVNSINNTRTNTGMFPTRSFKHVGDVLAAPELSTSSPFLNRTDSDKDKATAFKRSLNDAAYEWLPQQIMSLLRVGEPRFVVYAYGQTLRPAEDSVITSSGIYANLCTNYQITAEVAARAVVRVDGEPGNGSNPPRLVVESYNVLGPE